MVADILGKKHTELDPSEIQELIKHIRNLFSTIQNLKNTNKIACYIQYPKIPPILSESIALNTIQNGSLSLPIQSPQLGGNIADIIAYDKNDKLIKIEVKATGKKAFQNFGEKDIAADYLIWVFFDEFFQNSKQEVIELFILPNPILYFKSPQKITLTKFQKLTEGNLSKLQINLLNPF